MMKEEYLHHLFITRKLGNHFTTVKGEPVQIVDFGYYNSDAGPDFLNTKIIFNDLTFSGSIEFHVKASDWYAHNHQNDLIYENVILHVVYNYDKDIKIKNCIIPAIEIRDLIDHAHYQKYCSFGEQKNEILCANFLAEIDPVFIQSQLDKVTVERLNRKSKKIIELINDKNGDVEFAFILLLAQTFGGKVNGNSFSTLVEKIGINLIRKYKHDKFKLESLFFEVSDLIPEKVNDKYICRINDEGKYLAKLHNLNKMSQSEFRFSRMNPPGMPTFKLAQFVALLINFGSISDFFEGKFSCQQIKDRLDASASTFWKNHYNFQNATETHSTKISDSFKNLILINVLVPFLFSISNLEDKTQLKLYAINLLEQIPPESNNIIRKWREFNLNPNTAFESQAMIEQKNEYCNKKKCLFCKIGNQVLRK